VLDLEAAQSLDEALLSPAYVQDPYPVLARLRAADPVHWLEPWRMYLVTRYRNVQEVLRLDGTVWSAVGQTSAALAHLPPRQRAELGSLERLFSAGLLWSDPPDHTRIRAVVNKAMRPRDAEAMRPRIHGIVAEALDQIEQRHGEGAREPFDLVAEFAALIPVTVLAELLGSQIPMFLGSAPGRTHSPHSWAVPDLPWSWRRRRRTPSSRRASSSIDLP
jgi:cytochrome P450